MPGPLEGLRVVEVASSVPARACGRQFARWGAQVVTTAAEPDNEPATEENLLAKTLVANKLTVDSIREPAVSADVLIIDQPISSLPFTPNTDSCVVVDISPFGREGAYSEYAGNAFIAEAISGFMSVQGEAGKAPLRMPGEILARACGIAAFNAALASVLELTRSGRGQYIDVSCMQVLATIVPTLRTQLDRPEERDGGPGVRPLGVRLYQFGETWLSFNFALPPALPALLDIIGLDESHLPDDLREVRDRQNHVRLKAYVESLPSPFDAHDLFTIISAPPHSSAVGKVLRPAETTKDPQLSQLNYWQASKDRTKALRTGPPARLSRTPASPTASPMMFQGWRSGRLPRGNREAGAKPLTGIRIVDLTQAWIGPYASQVLSDLGADVIKVESLTKPDVWRKLPPKKPPHMANPDANLVNSSPNFNSVNRDKRSLTLDLGSERGHALFLDLVKGADIVMENYRPAVMPKLGLDYQSLRKVNPRLVMASFSAYGETGPYADYRGNGTTIEALAGWDSLFGYADGPPLAMGFYQADAITGLQMAATTLAALVHRELTGEGQHVRGSMLETAVDYIEELVLLEQLTGTLPRHGNRSPGIAPQGVYRCLGDDNWLALSVDSDRAWQALASLLQGTEASWSLAARQQHHDQIDLALTSWCGERTAQDAAAELQALGIAAAPVQTTDVLLRDPHLESIAWWQTLDHPDLGTHRYAGFPWRFSRSELSSSRASPRLGQDSRTILSDELGLGEATIDELFSAGISGEDW